MHLLLQHRPPANEFTLDRQELLVLLRFVREAVLHGAEVQECIVDRQLVRGPSGQRDQTEHHQNTKCVALHVTTLIRLVMLLGKNKFNSGCHKCPKWLSCLQNIQSLWQLA